MEARNRTRLTAQKVKALAEPGLYADGQTLYLRVSPGGSKAWVQRLAIRGKQTDIGLGSAALVTLAEARHTAYENRRLARAGGDPLAEKRKAAVPSFAEAAAKTLERRRPRWRNGKTEKIWTGILGRYAFPAIGDTPVDTITREDVLRILTPIWTITPESGKRCRQFMRLTFQWCTAHGYIDINPAGEAIDGALPTMPAVKEHYRALPYQEVAAALETIEGTGASMAAKLCFKFLVLTMVRSGEARGATWAEIDIEARAWRISADRMKMATAHVVPLSDAAVDVLEQARGLDDGSRLLFPSSTKRGRPLSSMTLTKLLRSTGLAERATVHGFRSSARTWMSEKTNADYATMEMCLAHAVGSAVERSYARSDLLAKRRWLMDQWAAFVTASPTAKVVKLHG